jgi:hypothetical protein
VITFDWLPRISFAVRQAAAITLFLTQAAIAGPETIPVPPCEDGPVPAIPAAGAAPNVALWHRVDLPTGWRLPACVSDYGSTAELIVTLAGRFTGNDDEDRVLERFGAISRFVTLRYWSITDRRWESLVTRANAVESSDFSTVRSDFTAAEMRSGRALYFSQEDNRSTSSVLYRLQCRIIGGGGFVIEIENISSVRYLLLQVFPAGALRVSYFLNHRASGAWDFYSLTQVGTGTAAIALKSERSFINRAVAAYRFTAGIATDADPPLAP